MKTQELLVDVYRPQTFSEVVGQQETVLFLTRTAKAGVARNILLTGPVGTGKTTLMRVYAKALNCEAPLSGEPCLKCLPCREPHTYFREVNVPLLDQSDGNFKATMRDVIQPFALAKIGVIFFDEAHALTRKSSDMLLKHLETIQARALYSGEQRVAIIFATTDGTKLPPALRSRLTKLSLSSLNNRDLMTLADRVARGAGLDCEQSALRCLSGWSDGCARNLLNALDQHAPRVGTWTLTQARKHLELDHDRTLTAYFCALADGNVDQQVTVFDEWRLSERDKLAWISEVLAEIYYRCILKKDAGRDQRMEGFDVKPITDRFARLFGEHERLGWGAIFDYFVRHIPFDGRASTLELIGLSEFVGRLTTSLAYGAAPHIIAPARDLKQPTSTRTTSATAIDDSAQTMTTPILINHGALSTHGKLFLSSTDVASIFNHASFFVQKWGNWFNAVASYGPNADDGAEQLAAIQRFCARLEKKGQERKADTRFAQISVIARSGQEYAVTSLLHLPMGSQAHLRKDWHSFVDGIGGTLTLSSAKAGKAFHFGGILDLVETLDRDIVLDGDDEPLWKRIGLKSKQMHEGNRIDSHIVFLSTFLVQECAAAIGTDQETLSAFDDRAWSDLRKGWEPDEHTDRTKLLTQQEAQGSQGTSISVHERARTWTYWRHK